MAMQAIEYLEEKHEQLLVNAREADKGIIRYAGLGVIAGALGLYAENKGFASLIIGDGVVAWGAVSVIPYSD